MPQTGRTNAWDTSLYKSPLLSLLSQEGPAKLLDSRSVEEAYNATLGSVALSSRVLTMGQALF